MHRLSIVALATLMIAAALPLATHAADRETLPPARETNRSALWEDRGVILDGFKNMYNFDIIELTTETQSLLPDGAEYPYRAWFFGWVVGDCNPMEPGCDAIYAARSRSLEEGWEVWSGDDRWTTDPTAWRAVVAAQEKPYDAWHNGDPTVVLHDGIFHLAYSSTGPNLDGILYGEKGDTDGTILCVMGATSRDGLHWQKSPEPILIHREDLGAPSVPGGESHLLGSYHRPALMREGDRWRLWFDYWGGNDRGVSLGLAENTGDYLMPGDWKVLAAGETPLSDQWVNPDMIKVRNVYFSYSDAPALKEGHVWTNRKIAEAISLDGRRFVMLGHVDPPAGVAAAHVPQALLVHRDGTDWLYVTFGRQIGGEPYDYRYDTIGMMRRTLTDDDLAAYAKLWHERFD